MRWGSWKIHLDNKNINFSFIIVKTCLWNVYDNFLRSILLNILKKNHWNIFQHKTFYIFCKITPGFIEILERILFVNYSFSTYVFYLNLKALSMLFSMIYNLHTFSDFFIAMGTYKKNWHLCFFSILLCKEKESTKHLLAICLIPRKSLRTHTNRSSTK